jgi:hypothetical protein
MPAQGAARRKKPGSGSGAWAGGRPAAVRGEAGQGATAEQPVRESAFLAAAAEEGLSVGEGRRKGLGG